MTTYFKKVLLPIEVSYGDYCWGRTGIEDVTRICPYFTNAEGPPECRLKIDVLEFNEENWVPKPKKCLELKQ